jgi:hypothetical protein
VKILLLLLLTLVAYFAQKTLRRGWNTPTSTAQRRSWLDVGAPALVLALTVVIAIRVIAA